MLLPDNPWEIAMNFAIVTSDNGSSGEPLRFSDYSLGYDFNPVYTGPPDDHSMYPRLLISGGVKLAYQDARDGNWEVYYQYIAPWGGGEIDNISEDTLPDKYPDIDGNNAYSYRKAAIAWQKWTGYDWEIYSTVKKQGHLVVKVASVYSGLGGSLSEEEIEAFRLYPYDNDATDGITYMAPANLPPDEYVYSFTAVDENGDTLWQTPVQFLSLRGDKRASGGPLGTGNDGRGVYVRTLSNPSYGRLILQYTLTRDVPVSIKLFDVSGRLVEEVERKVEGAGEHRWTATEVLGSGVYFYELQAGKDLFRGKVVVVK